MDCSIAFVLSHIVVASQVQATHLSKSAAQHAARLGTSTHIATTVQQHREPFASGFFIFVFFFCATACSPFTRLLVDFFDAVLVLILESESASVECCVATATVSASDSVCSSLSLFRLVLS